MILGLEWKRVRIVLKRGKIARQREIKEVRELRREDLEILKELRPPKAIVRFRDAHHWVARLLVAGMSVTEVAQATGYSIQRIGDLKRVPAFQELMAKFRNATDEGIKEILVDYTSLKMSNRLKAERQLSEKLDQADEEGELLSTRELVSISREQDRSTQVNVNIDFASQLDRAMNESRRVLDLTPARQITSSGMNGGTVTSSSDEQVPRRRSLQ